MSYNEGGGYDGNSYGGGAGRQQDGYGRRQEGGGGGYDRPQVYILPLPT